MLAHRSIAAFAAALFLVPAAATASVSSDAQALINQGQAAQALQQLDAHLARNPQDAEARFTRGLALVQLNRANDAIRVFAGLTRDYPQLPEPYNNLAVLYAAQGEYEKARDALQAALATHPSYATAHENLGDIYAALAGAAYNRALQLDESNQVLRRKLALLNQLDPSAAAEIASAPVNAPPPARQPAATPAPAAAATPAPTPAPVATAPAAPSQPAVDAVTAELRAAVQQTLDAWASAWSKQDLDAYFVVYADDFVPEGGLSRSAWQTQRRDRISAPASIRVTVSNPTVNSTGDGKLSVNFRQQYESDNFSDSVAKVLDLKITPDGWKIVREYSR